jgi:hypothetical protein
MSLFPEHNWDISKFRFNKPHLPSGYWKDTTNQRSFLDQLASKLNITKQDDWYKVSVKKVVENGGQSVLQKYGSLRNGTQRL